MISYGPFSNEKDFHKHVADYVVGVVRDSEQQTSSERARWKVNENLFSGKMDWPQDDEGSDWQSRIFVHEYSPMIRDASIAAVETIIQNENFASIVTGSQDPKTREIARIRDKIAKHYLLSDEQMAFGRRFLQFCITGAIFGHATLKHTVRQKLYYKPEVVIEEIKKQETKSRKGVKAENADTSILSPDGFTNIEGGLDAAVNMILGPSLNPKRRTVASQKVLELCMELKVVNPFNYFWMPDTDDINASPYHVERIYLKYFQLLPYFDAGIFDKRLKKKMLANAGRISSSAAGSFSTFESQKYSQRNQNPGASRYMPDCELLEYYGPIISPDGSEVLIENAHVVVGNGKHVLKCGINGHWDQRSVYRTAVFNQVPFKPNGVGIADGAVATQMLLNELYSLFVDALKIDVLTPAAVKVDQLQDPTQLEGGFRPNEVIHLTGEGRAQDAFAELPQKSNIAPTLFQTVESLRLSGQKAASVNTMTANPSSRARITGTEIESNEARRNQTINSLAGELDYNCLEPLVRRTDQYVLQFGFDNANLQLLTAKGVLTQSEYQLLESMPEVERFIEANKNYMVEIRGFRAVSEREREKRATAELASQVMQMPPQVQQMLNWKQVISDLVERYGFDASRWIVQNTPHDKAREENMLLQNNQMLSVWDQDDDMAHLPIHYEAIIQMGPVQALIAHVQMHMQRAMAMGAQIPPPPPEVAQYLGMGQPAGPMGGPPPGTPMQ